MSIAKKLASETAAYSLSSILAKAINYLFGLFIVKYISTEEYGIYSKLYAYAGFLLVFLTHGMETTFFRFLHKQGYKDKAYSVAFTSITNAVIFFIALIFIFITPIGNFVEESHRLIKIFAFIMVFDVLCALPFASLRAQNRPFKFAFYKILNIGIFIFFNGLLFIGLPALDIDFGISKVENIFIANLTASVITFILLAFQTEKFKFTYDAKLHKELWIYGFPIMLVGIAGMTNEMLDRAMLTKLLPYDAATNNIQLAIYSFNYKFAMPISMFLQAYRFAAEPIFFKEASQANNRNMYAEMMKFYIICACFIFLGIMLLMPAFQSFFIWYTPNAKVLFEGVFMVPILLLANLCLGIYFNISTWYKITDKTHFGAIISGIGAVITIVLNLILVPAWGYAGAAWATLFVYIIMVVIGFALERKYFPIPYQYGRIGFYLFISLALFAIYTYFIANNIESLPIKSAIALLILGIYVILVYKTEKRK